MRLLVAPDSFKGSLTSVEVARAIAEGWLSERPEDEVGLAPLADGGEGTLEAIAATELWTWEDAVVPDPIGRPVTARWLRSLDGRRAFVELASASGLSRLSLDERDPFGATTRGTGEILRVVLDRGIRHVVLGIGGSATTDGGRGILEALGARVVDRGDGHVDIDLDGLDPRLGETELRIACDVTNPLLGERGAAATYGPQKGADAAAVEGLDRRLASWADALEATTGRREREAPGAGAAGGTAFGLLCIAGSFGALELVPGIDLVIDETGLVARLRETDLVITGEGRIDGQTAFGKTALGVARLAEREHVRCVAVGGGVEPEGIAALEPLGVQMFPVWERPVPLAEAMAAGAAPLVACGARLARAISLLPGHAQDPALPARPAKASATTKASGQRKPPAKRKKRRTPDPARTWARRLERTRPGLVADVLAGLATIHGHPVWERRLDPTSELILTILTQNSADTNAERAFESLRDAYPSGLAAEHHVPGPGWGGVGLSDGAPPDWAAVEGAPIQELVEVIRHGGLANQKAPRLQATLRTIREARGDYSLEFLGDMAPLEARAWLTAIDGIGKKTASVLLMFSFGMPLMAVDRHVERVSQRVGLIPPKASADDAHDLYLALLRPAEMYEAHVNLIRHGRVICHARNPEHEICPLRDRCRFVDRRAP